MENSFFEYRDETGVDSDSESEFIDNSLIDESIGPKKTPGKKNQTAFIPESEDSLTEGYLLIKFYFIQSTTSKFILRLNYFFTSQMIQKKRVRLPVLGNQYQEEVMLKHYQIT